MRIAISGVGLRSGHVLSFFKEQMPEVEFVGYYDPQPSHLEMLGNEIKRYDTIENMLDDSDPDLFFIGSPNHRHLSDLKLGFAAGVQMFCEKPVVTTLEDTMELARLIADNPNTQVMIGLVLRYSQHMVDLRKYLAQGALGDIASIEANEHIGPYHGAFFMRDWRRKTSYSGGFMLEKCCHDLDLYNMITQSRPARVASFGARRSFVETNRPADGADMDIYQVKQSVWENTDDPFGSDGDIVDCQTAILEYESGASMSFHTNINVPDEHRRFCVIGGKGMAEGDFMRGFLKITDATSSKMIFDADYSEMGTAKGHYGADEMMVSDLVSHLRGEMDELPVSIVDALQAGIAALAIDQARKEKRLVELGNIWTEFDAALAGAQS